MKTQKISNARILSLNGKQVRSRWFTLLPYIVAAVVGAMAAVFHVFQGPPSTAAIRCEDGRVYLYVEGINNIHAAIEFCKQPQPEPLTIETVGCAKDFVRTKC